MFARVALAVLLVLALLPVSATGVATTTTATGTSATATGTTSTTTPSGTSTSSSGTTNHSSASPHIVAVYPNPVAMDDAGEFVVVTFPRKTTLSAWTLSDEQSTSSLSNRTVSGTVAFSTAPNRTENLTSFRVLPLENLSLANSGETVTLGRTTGDGSETDVDSVTYVDAPESECWRPFTQSWRPLGATNFTVTRSDAATARVFVLPDDPNVPVETLRSAKRRLLLAGYSFTSRRITDLLIAAANRGVKVHVLVDDAPVGGISTREAAVLDRLTNHGVTVDVIGGERGRYDFHHAKYAIADDEAIVMTENWKPAGVGGHSSRGWGAVVGGEAVDNLEAIFDADTSWYVTTPWQSFREGRSFNPTTAANESYPTKFPAKRVDAVSVLAAPDDAESGVLSLLRSANDSIDVQQMTVGSIHQPFIRATLAAARRGVAVRVLLSNAWYVHDDNQRVVRWLNERADAEGLPLEAELASPHDYEKIHAKGVIVDRRHVVVGSLNWNNNSARENREVAIVLHGKAAGKYYSHAFEADWGRREDRFPVGLAAFVTIAIAGAVWIAKREIRFES
ncbi:phosphatidylserine/phosphatidylglycerophosphate/cardiolipin synthase family protein [Haladaptatus sp. R4]|uniref:phospholipase D-like domain-containing protein n=1 Tax=Haladaptatus sp. R4 TaxID=1679489 RepID=UPI000AD03E91|nr:phospholipase D-like domain-containing protein [Haladaptatus sp. R4]